MRPAALIDDLAQLVYDFAAQHEQQATALQARLQWFWSIGTGGSFTRTTLVGVAALFLGGCATPLTVSTAQTPELPVERWRGLIVAAENRCAPYRSNEYAYPQAVEDDIIQRLGGLFSPYTNEVFDSKGDTDIEHVVGAVRGARQWAVPRRYCDQTGVLTRPAKSHAGESTREPQPKGREGCGRVAARGESVLVRADRRGRAPSLPTDDRPA